MVNEEKIQSQRDIFMLWLSNRVNLELSNNYLEYLELTNFEDLMPKLHPIDSFQYSENLGYTWSNGDVLDSMLEARERYRTNTQIYDDLFFNRKPRENKFEKTFVEQIKALITDLKQMERQFRRRWQINPFSVSNNIISNIYPF